MRSSTLTLLPLALICQMNPLFAEEKATEEKPPPGRFIEEIRVTADRREGTVQDTSIAVTTVNMRMMEEFGIRNQEDLQNYVPSVVIQTYDITIRGVGRNFRTLGGDPGIAVYEDNIYAEDFFTATVGGLYDLERIEFLRGPQGTLYGRNGIGGAVNFHSNKPEKQFSSEIRTVMGQYNTLELYGYVTGPIIKDKLAGRFVFTDRNRDGLIDNLASGDDLDSQDDNSFALSFMFEPTDTLKFYLRGTTRDRDRIIAGAFGDEAFVVSENAGVADEITGNKRNTTALIFGLRNVDPGVPCASLTDRSTPNCAVPGRHTFEYNWQGNSRFAQRIVPGVDPATANKPNFAYGHNGNLINATTLGNGRSIPRIDGSDLKMDIDGDNYEKLDYQSGTFIADWEVSDSVSLKYIFGYTDYLYERNTDFDHTSSGAGEQFYVAQENENFQHEIQVFADIGDNLLLTAGLFYYEASIDLQIDQYADIPRYTQPANYGTDPGTGLPLSPDEAAIRFMGFPIFAIVGARDRIGLHTARDEVCPTQDLAGTFDPGPIPVDSSLSRLISKSVIKSCIAYAPTTGDPGDALNNGPATRGSLLRVDSLLRTRSKAVFLQLEWMINDQWSLTAGGRWATDEKLGEENALASLEFVLPT